MTELQILNKVLAEKRLDLITYNNLDEEYFAAYADEYSFIINHAEKYGCVPDTATFLEKFPDFNVLQVTEPDEYLIDDILETHLYSKMVPIVNRVAELAQANSNDAVEYLRSVMSELESTTRISAVDIIATAESRYQEWQERKENPSSYFIPTGFKELDQSICGWSRGEEFVVFVARTGQGKSWVLIKSLEHAHKMGLRVGLIEPEMSAVKTGYRFDTLHGHISNFGLVHGTEVEGYEEYIKKLNSTRRKVPFFVSTPKDFSKKITVSKLRMYCISNKLDILAIDGITYLTDERYKKGDNKTTSLTNISEDLMSLSVELKIPILVVVQANREGLKEKKTPDLENIRDSDGISHNASTVISVSQKPPGLSLEIKKARNGAKQSTLTYAWDIDKGVFHYIPDSNIEDDAELVEQQEKEFDSPKTPYKF